MSIIYCENCNKHIDTDFEASHEEECDDEVTMEDLKRRVSKMNIQKKLRKLKRETEMTNKEIVAWVKSDEEFEPDWGEEKKASAMEEEPLTLETLKQGDWVESRFGTKRRVLGVCGEVYFLSNPVHSRTFDEALTAETLRVMTYKPAQPQEEATIRKFRTVEETQTLPVDYSRRIKYGVKAGKYDWVNEDINDENFGHERHTGVASVEIKLFHFDELISSEDAIKRMNKEGYRPANIQELFAFSENGWDGEDWVVALGSVWRSPYDDRRVPCLGRGGSERSLSLDWFGDDWDAHYRFAACRIDPLTLAPVFTREELDELVEILDNRYTPAVKESLHQRVMSKLKAMLEEVVE